MHSTRSMCWRAAMPGSPTPGRAACSRYGSSRWARTVQATLADGTCRALSVTDGHADAPAAESACHARQGLARAAYNAVRAFVTTQTRERTAWNTPCPPLPYAIDALAPHLSKETLEFHHGKHHNAYVVNLNNLQKGTEFESMTPRGHRQEVVRRHLQQRGADLEPHLLLELHEARRRRRTQGRAGRGDQRQVGQLRRLQGSLREERGRQLRLGLDLAGEEGRRQRRHRQHGRRRHAADHRRQGRC